MGAGVKAAVGPAPGQGISLEEPDRFRLEIITAYKRPRCYQAAAGLPRDLTGKIPKGQLRQYHDPVTSTRLEEHGSWHAR